MCWLLMCYILIAQKYNWILGFLEIDFPESGCKVTYYFSNNKIFRNKKITKGCFVIFYRLRLSSYSLTSNH